MQFLRRRTVGQWLAAAALPPWGLASPRTGHAQAVIHDLQALPAGATLHKVSAQPAVRHDRRALQVAFTEAGMAERDVSVDNATFVLIPGRLRDGTIEVDLLGRLNGKGPPDARAFVGLAYRVADPEAHFESVYLRPLNGRKKNPPAPRDRRAIQYFAYPDWKFPRLRELYPDGRYEAGANIADDEWIRLQLDIDGTRVVVTVDGQVAFTVSETKAAPIAGGIGLWVGIGSDGYFANLRVTPR